ncbi:hypothetical protein H5J25_18025 [Sphingomonas aliaeris]|uniref:Uncharacterized protein n=1 Tax=Sphingomonas aliaeris TaxID=2759526 RepID=A0A974NUL9_9SPHN|nr:hypothetical protein [Sphingomonas aliaeris]QQV77192.1 hypothetical protein H5J25_18025 [Sphingomonas aliaeris]
MSIDPIAFPLPVVVKGYACLTGAEVELAKKDIDPARPSETSDVPAPRSRPRPKNRGKKRHASYPTRLASCVTR